MTTEDPEDSVDSLNQEKGVYGTAEGPDSLSGDVSGIFRPDLNEQLSNFRRRAILKLLEEEDEWKKGDLAEVVAALEEGKPVYKISNQKRKSVVTALQQKHLDKLDDSSLIKYERDEVTRGELYDVAIPYLEFGTISLDSDWDNSWEYLALELYERAKALLEDDSWVDFQDPPQMRLKDGEIDNYREEQVDEIPVGVVFDLFKNERRSGIVHSLYNERPPLSKTDLARAVSAIDSSKEPQDLAYEEYKNVYTTFTNNHLAKLADWDIIDYDEKKDEVDQGNAFHIAQEYAGLDFVEPVS